MASVEWWRGWIITRENQRAVLGYRHSSTGIVICPYPHLQRLRLFLEVVLLAIAASVVRLPRPLTLTMFVAWIAVRYAVARLAPQISRRIVLDDEQLRVEASGVSRFALVPRADIVGVAAEAAAVVVRRGAGQTIALPLGAMSEKTARTIAMLLREELRAPAVSS